MALPEFRCTTVDKIWTSKIKIWTKNNFLTKKNFFTSSQWITEPGLEPTISRHWACSTNFVENHNIGRLSGTITQPGFVEKAKIYVKSIVTTREANFLGFQFIAINSALFIAINSINTINNAISTSTLSTYLEKRTCVCRYVGILVSKFKSLL